MPVKLVGKTVLIDIEVVDTQLDYNILLDRSYMYEILAVASSMFRIMMCPHEGKIITIYQLTYYEKTNLPIPDDIFPLVSSSHVVITTYTELSLDQFKPSTLLGTFPGGPLVRQELVPNTGAPVCMMTSSNNTQKQEPILDDNNDVVTNPNLLPNSITNISFLYPPLGFVSHQVIATLTLPKIALAIPVWHLAPRAMPSSTTYITTGVVPIPPEDNTTTHMSHTQVVPMPQAVSIPTLVEAKPKDNEKDKKEKAPNNRFL